MSDDLYEDLDLDEVFEEKEKRLTDNINKDLEKKYTDALETISQLQKEKTELEKKLKIMEINFKSLIETIRPELNRKDTLIATLRREKDDICFRRKPPNQIQAVETQSASNCTKEQQNNLGDKLQREAVENMASTVSIKSNTKIEKDPSSQSNKRSPAHIESKSLLLEKTNSFNKRTRDKDDKDSRYNEKYRNDRHDRYERHHRNEKHDRNERYDKSREIKSDNNKESHHSSIDKKHHSHRDRHSSYNNDNENLKDDPKISRDRDNHRGFRRIIQNNFDTECLAFDENANIPKIFNQQKIISKSFRNNLELDRKKFRKERKRKMRNPNKNILGNEKLTEDVPVLETFKIPNKRNKEAHLNSPNVEGSFKDEYDGNFNDNKFKFPNLTKLNGDVQLKQRNIVQLIEEYRRPINADYLYHESDVEDDKTTLHKTLREFEFNGNNERVLAEETDEENFYKNPGTDSDEIIIEETDDEHYANAVPTQKFYCQPIKSEMCDRSVRSYSTNEEVKSENEAFQPFNFEEDTIFGNSKDVVNRSLYDMNSNAPPFHNLNIDKNLQIKIEDDSSDNYTNVGNISGTENDLDLKMQNLEALVDFHEKHGRFLGQKDIKTYEENFTEKLEYEDFLNYFKLKNIKNEKFDDTKLLQVNKSDDLRKAKNKLKNMYKKNYTYNNSNKTLGTTKKQTKRYNNRIVCRPRRNFN